MLLYKKLLPQGIVGRHHLASTEGSDEGSGVQASEEGSSAASVPSYRSKYDRIKWHTTRKTLSYPASRIGPESTQGVPSPPDLPSISQSVFESDKNVGEQSEFPLPELGSSVSTSGRSSYVHASHLTSATTMEGEGSVHYITKDVIEESRVMSKKRAPGITEREFPLRSQSSGFSHSQMGQGRSLSLTGSTARGYAPVKLNRVYGRNDKVAVLNLVGIHFSHIVYTASNVVVLFDFYHNQQRMLQGHKNKITCLTSNTQNTHFASGDVGPGSVIIVWDTITGFPFRTLPVSHGGDGDFGVTAIAFVGKEDYIGSIGNDMRLGEMITSEEQPPDLKQPNEAGGQGDQQQQSNNQTVPNMTAKTHQQNICIWHISGHEAPKHDGEHHHHHEKAGGKPTATFTIPLRVGYQHEIVFCNHRPEFFLTTGDKYVVFYTWLKQEKKILHHIPKRGMTLLPRINRFTQSIWIKNSNSCITGTDIGYIIIWAAPYALGLGAPSNPNLNIKEFKRALKVGTCAVTALISHNEWIIIGDEEGVVKFFDAKFRIVRWTKSDPQVPLKQITFISCNQTDGLADFKKEMQENFDQKQDHTRVVKDWTYGGQKFKQPSQTTVERPALFAPDFTIGCVGGDVHYCHLGEGRADRIVIGTPGPIVAIDTCPNTTHVTISTLEGHIQMYDYMASSLIFDGLIFKSGVEVSCFKFHPTGSFAFFGTRNGQIYFRRAYTWTSMEAPLDNCSQRVERIIFSRDGTHMAHYDNSFAVTLYNYNVHRNSWSLVGKYRSHYRPIVDFAFFYDEVESMERLFSLGEDRLLIEYDISISSKALGLRVKERIQIDTQFVPTAMSMDTPWSGHKPILMVANTGNKIRFYDQDMQEFKKTCRGPTYGTVVDRIIRIKKPSLHYHHDSGFLLMTLGDKIGLMKTPVDGNPFKYMAVLCHPGGVQSISLGCSGKEIFTTGIQDGSLFCWEANISALETCALSGGSGITPYMKMLDAGLPPGQSLVEDVENVFYHLLIRRSKSQQDMLSKKLEIPIIDIPLVLRTCGTFLSEEQNKQMMEEAVLWGNVRDGEDPTMIPFDDFIKMFANYKDIPPVLEDEITEAFSVLGVMNEQEQVYIPNDKFIEYMCEQGEKIDPEELPHMLPNICKSGKVGERSPPWRGLIGHTEYARQSQQDAVATEKSRGGETGNQAGVEESKTNMGVLSRDEAKARDRQLLKESITLHDMRDMFFSTSKT